MYIKTLIFAILFVSYIVTASASCDKDKLDAYYENPESIATNKLGQRSLEEFSFVLECNSGEIYKTYTRYLKSNDYLVGKFVFTVTINPDGTISDVKTVTSTLSLVDFENEILKSIGAMKLGKKNIEATTITYPMEFSPN